MSLLRRSPEHRRVRALGTVDQGPLRDYLRVPFPSPDAPLDEVPLLAVDIETTGLNPKTDRVLSIGWVPVDGRAIMLAGARRVLVSDGEAVGPSATIHGLTDDVLSGGSPLESALAALLHDLAGRALLAHFARIETGFLSYACQRIWGEGLACAVVDTFVLERRALQDQARGGRWQSEPEQGALRLWTARERRGLPVYRAHEALTDALACAELYLAQRSELAARSPTAALTLRDLT